MKLALPKFSRLQLASHVAAVFPLLWLGRDALIGNLTANPIQAAEQRTGLYALTLLIASLAITPIFTLTGYTQVIRLRRPFGLYAFLYAAIHLYIFLKVDYGLEWNFIWLDSKDKRYIWVGLAAFLILSALAFTSFGYWKKTLRKNWKRLHRLVYAAGALVILHFAWAVKGDFTRVSGETLRPVLYGVGVGVLLMLRIPVVKKAVLRVRQRVNGFRYERFIQRTADLSPPQKEPVNEIEKE